MDWVTLGGAFLTWGLTELMKKNPKMKEHAPLVVTVLSILVGAIQAAITATVAQAAGADTTAAVAGVAVVSTDSFGSNVVTNMGGSVLIANARVWLFNYLLPVLFKKYLKIG